LPHQKNLARRVQRRERSIALHLVYQFRREALVFCDFRPAAHHAMPDRNRVYKRRLAESFRYQRKSCGYITHDWLFIHELSAISTSYPGFDPELS
jgi:hypothetical protein